jgi:hypothetical protein
MSDKEGTFLIFMGQLLPVHQWACHLPFPLVEVCVRSGSVITERDDTVGMEYIA